MSRLKFQLEAEAPGSGARAAIFATVHGEVKTPVFMPVGTQATVKGQPVEALRTAGARVLLANTYHLLLRPGTEVFRQFGGIHRFMNWDGPVLTDSGGFQIFSLPHARRMDEEGATFQSYVDGRTFLLSPEESIRTQIAIGSDIMMVLDQCIPSTAERREAERAMHLTHRWALRSLNARMESPQALFGIVQGACFHDLRKASAAFLTEHPFDGFAIGGLAVGETREQREEFTEATAALLPRNLPRYLMGVGTPLDILEAVHRGVDMFDCILPTALAQRGVAFTSIGKLQLRRGVYKLSQDALDPACGCATCRDYSRAYLHHLIKADELLGWQLIATHNLTFYHSLMAQIREAVLTGGFLELYRSKRESLAGSDEENPVQTQRRRRRKVRATRLGDYEVQISPLGYGNVRQISSGEVMHSVSDPAEEAERLYIEQSRLFEKLLVEKDKPLVIWDVGLGAASNAMAAVRCFEESFFGMPREPRPVHLISFERDLDPLRLALLHLERFKHLRHGAPHDVLKAGSWNHSSGLLSWKLLSGDFLDLFKTAPGPDLIFYDPFSFKTDSALWSPAVFSAIYKHCERAGALTELYTYSASTAVRAALLAGGFFVARGVGTGVKEETTIAFTRDEIAQQHPGLLGKDWLEKWLRSGAKIPVSVVPEERPGFEARILGHRQFSFALAE